MIDFINRNEAPVTAAEMEAIYAGIRTPEKLGAVMKWDNAYTDSPSVFLYGEYFYMYYIAISKDVSTSGYETHLARSSDLINWEKLGVVFGRNTENSWDSRQCAGYAAFMNIDYDSEFRPQRVNGKYYLSYLGGNNDGYEPDPLYMGLAYTRDLTKRDDTIRFPKPILRPDDTDARAQERKTIYRSFIFEDPKRITGYPYVNIYNAKDAEDRERIFLAVSCDGESWERYGNKPCLDLISADSEEKITGDPQIVMIGDIYVMFFFRRRKGMSAYNTFACSRDLVNWTVWDGEALISAEYEWEKDHAHKTWFIRHNGKNYHYYCAVNKDKNERFIALAVSE